MNLTIKSKILNTTLTFSRPGTASIYADINGLEGTRGKQICRGGELSGSTISYYGDDEKAFRSVCRAWYRAYAADMVAYKDLFRI